MRTKQSTAAAAKKAKPVKTTQLERQPAETTAENLENLFSLSLEPKTPLANISKHPEYQIYKLDEGVYQNLQTYMHGLLSAGNQNEIFHIAIIRKNDKFTINASYKTKTIANKLPKILKKFKSNQENISLLKILKKYEDTLKGSVFFESILNLEKHLNDNGWEDYTFQKAELFRRQPDTQFTIDEGTNTGQPISLSKSVAPTVNVDIYFNPKDSVQALQSEVLNPNLATAYFNNNSNDPTKICLPKDVNMQTKRTHVVLPADILEQPIRMLGRHHDNESKVNYYSFANNMQVSQPVQGWSDYSETIISPFNIHYDHDEKSIAKRFTNIDGTPVSDDQRYLCIKLTFAQTSELVVYNG